MLQIVVEVPQNYLDVLHQVPEDFAQEAKLAMAAKLYEMKRLSSGMAAQLIGMDRLTFLAQLPRLGVPLIDLTGDELVEDVLHA